MSLKLNHTHILIVTGIIRLAPSGNPSLITSTRNLDQDINETEVQCCFVPPLSFQLIFI